MKTLIETDHIKTKIYTVRGVRVMLDRDLADLYHVKTKELNQTVKRNIKRFPESFMFQLTKEEIKSLRSQIVTTNISPKSRVLPHVFTEYGTLALSSVLNNEIAIQVNQKIIEAFVEIRHQIALKPEYELLREKIRRIESEVKEIKSNQLVENQLVSGKLTQLSHKVLGFSKVLDEFQDTNIIIKRPDEGETEG
jgi:hypothetical protein